MKPEKDNSISLEYNCVIVIESLLSDDKKSGRILYDEIIARRCEQKQKGHLFFDVDNKEQFLQVLTEIGTIVREKNVKPLIHFEIHGSEYGFELKNSDKLRWDAFVDKLRLINILLKNQLIISLATCFGAHIGKVIDINKPAPYWGYIGAKESIQEYEVMEDFSDFFNIFLANDDLAGGIAAIAANQRRDKYAFIHCEGIFEYFIERPYASTKIDKKKKFHKLKGYTKFHAPLKNRQERRTELKKSIKAVNRRVVISQMKNVFLMRGSA